MAGNSKDSKILAYKDMINQLNKTISTQTELIQSLQKTLEDDRSRKIHLLSGTGVDNAWDHNCDFSIDIIDAGSGKGFE